MAAWWCWPLPAWLGSSAAWFVLLNVVVGAIFALSSRPQPPSPSSSASPRRRGVTRRASSVLLQRIRSFSTFSFPSYNSQETEEITTPRRRPPSTPRAAVAVASAAAPAAAAEGDDIDEDEGDANAMSMDEVYALVLAAGRPQAPTEDETARYEVDAKAEEFKEDLRQQRLRSIFNYTQMLKQRAAAAARRPPVAAPPDTTNH